MKIPEESIIFTVPNGKFPRKLKGIIYNSKLLYSCLLFVNVFFNIILTTIIAPFMLIYYISLWSKDYLNKLKSIIKNVKKQLSEQSELKDRYNKYIKELNG